VKIKRKREKEEKKGNASKDRRVKS